jgi:hypothetical protein|tara:strand:+ start:331 stop:537 length:207 start_codon:yes stop_codon:yes gene_type:complete
MSFKSGNTVIGKADPLMGLPILTKEDIFLMLNIIRKTEFKGDQVEELFKITLKLQEMFVRLNKFEDKK